MTAHPLSFSTAAGSSLRNSIAIVSILAGILCVSVGATAQAADKSEERVVKQAVAEFYSALNALFTGDVRPMQQVWSHTNDVTYMGPGGGMQVGWKQVRAVWKSQAEMKLGGRIEPADMHLIVGSDIAVTHNYERGENMVDGKPQKVSIRATNVFRKEHGQWKMIGHHTDLLPFLEK